MVIRCGEKKIKTVDYELALILILVGTVCFYRLDTIALFITMNAFAGIIVAWKHFQKKRLKVSFSPFFVWITAIFVMFLIYGSFFLRAGIFNTDRYVIVYVQCILIYCIFKALLSEKNGEQRLAFGFCVTSVICLILLVINELSLLQSNDVRVGESLSGNVNAVGMALGVMSMFLAYQFGKTKNIRLFVLIMIIVAFMLTTGSKKTIVYLIADVYIIYTFAKNKTIGKLVLITMAGILVYMIFGVEYFYNLIGSRIIDMLGQFGFDIPGAKYSSSTAGRMFMIEEGFRFWSEHPFMGGGANYFQLRTSTAYEYSHCNVTELLCTFGLVGTILYYSPHIVCLASYRKLKRVGKQCAIFAIILTLLAMLVDWMAVTYSSFATCYIPIIYFFVVKERSRKLEA